MLQEGMYLMVIFLIRNGLGNECTNLSETVLATEIPQNVTSPNFPKKYPRTTSCVWVVKSKQKDSIIKFKILYFSLFLSAHCYADYLEVRDGSYRLHPKIIKWCGNKPASKIYKTTEGEAHFTFQAVSFGDDANGFFLQFWAEHSRYPTEQKPVFTIMHRILAGVTALILISFIIAMVMIFCVRHYRLSRTNILEFSTAGNDCVWRKPCYKQFIIINCFHSIQ